MNKVMVAVATVLLFSLTIPNVKAAEAKRYMSRSELTKTLKEKEAEIAKLKKEIEVLKEKNKANPIIPTEMERTSRDLPLTFICEKTQWDGKDTTYIWGKVVNNSSICYDSVKVIITAEDVGCGFLGRNSWYCEPDEIGVKECGYLEKKWIETDKKPDKFIFKVVGDEVSSDEVRKRKPFSNKSTSTTSAILSNKPNNQKQTDATKKQKRKSGKDQITVLKHGDKEFNAKVLGKPVFGIRLGEHVDEIKKRFKVVQPSDKRDRTWVVDVANKKIKELMIFTYEGIIGAISVKLINASSIAAEQQIATTYKSYIIDPSVSTQIQGAIAYIMRRDMIGSKDYAEGYIFILEVDGETISIEISADYIESDCLLFYIYHDLIDYDDDIREDNTLEGIRESL